MKSFPAAAFWNAEQRLKNVFMSIKLPAGRNGITTDERKILR